MSSYDEYYETDDPWERHQQRMELDAHLARCREEETKRSASMARAGELVQHGSVADALLPALVRHLATLRALACTCRAWRAKVREHFASLAQLQLYRHDVSESNAAFVYGPLLEHRPDIHVIFVREDDDGKVKESIAMRGLKKWVDGRRKSGKWVLSTFGAGDLPLFFCSRAVAKMPELRLLLPREDESKGPISFTCGDLSSLRFAWSDPNLGGCGKFKMVQHKLARCAFNMVAGCHLVAALEALTEPAWLEKADLDLSYLHLDDEGARTLALKMRKNAPPKSIRLAHTMSRDGSLGMLGVLGKRTEVRVDLSCLQTLSIQGGRLWERAPFLALDTMLWSLGEPNQLTKLDLNDSRMGAQRMRMLSRHFPESRSLHSLQELILYKNNLGNHGLDYLQENARTMPKLRYLNIGHNYVDERVQLNFLNWVAREAEWPRIERIDMFYDPNPPLIRLVLKTCDMARARCEWSELLNRESRWMDDPEASDYDVPQGHTTEESSSSDESVSVSDEEEESDSDDEEEDHDE
tara:strand:- start:1292 stop:2863 length:1572 start_codon:yes stop_codon:yes gene_type:complete